MTFEQFREQHPRWIAAATNYDNAMEALSSGNRWGESRRFSGRAAGNRLARISKATEKKSKTWDSLERLWQKQYASNQQ